MTDPTAQLMLSAGGYALSLLLGIIVFLVKRELALLTKFSEDQRTKWERHQERHMEDAGKAEEKRVAAMSAVQEIKSSLLEHCAESNDRFLTKDEFVSSTTYLTKKTDEVSRLLQSMENILSRR